LPSQTIDPADLTLERLRDEVEHLTGQVVLVHDTTLAVLRGVGMDEDDLYYIATPLGRPQKDTWYSAVGACADLKEHLPEETYTRMERVFSLNITMPTDFEMLVQFEGTEPVPYERDIHIPMRRDIQEWHYHQDVARVRAANAQAAAQTKA
jgi:hypothetical protein